MASLNTISRPVLFFDGECNLCNGAVQFVVRHDKKNQFLFATLQSEAGKQARQNLQQNANVPESVILYYNGRYFVRSSAALHTAKLLGGLWPICYAGIIIPRFLRDAVYDFVSRNRYKWFGKRNECMIPSEELKKRFLPEERNL